MLCLDVLNHLDNYLGVIMTTQISVKKLNTLPQTLAANTLYFIKNATSGLVDIYVSDSTGAVVYHSVTKNDIELITDPLATSISILEQRSVLNIFQGV